MSTNYFKELLEKFPKAYYLGLGNPHSNILFVGKEPGDEIGTESSHGTVGSYWNDNNNCWDEKKYAQKYKGEGKLRHLNHTWQRYQKLYDLILEKLGIPQDKKEDKYEISFVENVFTTELSHLSAKTTKEAKTQDKFQDELERRKKDFFSSEFIKNFQIVLIFASDNQYIDYSEVCRMFNVKFDKVYEIGDENKRKDKIWAHYSSDNNKLLLHTRQLTNSIKSGVINKLAEIIANFVIENKINIIH